MYSTHYTGAQFSVRTPAYVRIFHESETSLTLLELHSVLIDVVLLVLVSILPVFVILAAFIVSVVSSTIVFRCCFTCPDVHDNYFSA